MQIELPPRLTGDLRKDVEILWDAVFRLTEKLRLDDEERRNKEEKA